MRGCGSGGSNAAKPWTPRRCPRPRRYCGKRKKTVPKQSRGSPFQCCLAKPQYPVLHKKRSSTPATDSPASVSMLLARGLCGCETDPRRPLSMLGSLVTGGAEISAEQKGAFILQAPAPSNAQEGERPVCSLTTGLALGRTQTLCTPKH